MKINKLITEHVTNKVNELKDTLVETTIDLLAMGFGDENVDIKLEKPITLVNDSLYFCVQSITFR